MNTSYIEACQSLGIINYNSDYPNNEATPHTIEAKNIASTNSDNILRDNFINDVNKVALRIFVNKYGFQWNVFADVLKEQVSVLKELWFYQLDPYLDIDSWCKEKDDDLLKLFRVERSFSKVAKIINDKYRNEINYVEKKELNCRSRYDALCSSEITVADTMKIFDIVKKEAHLNAKKQKAQTKISDVLSTQDHIVSATQLDKFLDFAIKHKELSREQFRNVAIKKHDKMKVDCKILYVKQFKIISDIYSVIYPFLILPELNIETSSDSSSPLSSDPLTPLDLTGITDSALQEKELQIETLRRVYSNFEKVSVGGEENNCIPENLSFDFQDFLSNENDGSIPNDSQESQKKRQKTGHEAHL